MKLPVDVAQALIGDVSIDLGCGDILVAKKLLDSADINSLIQ